MKYAVGLLVFIGLLVICASVMFAQTAADPSGQTANQPDGGSTAAIVSLDQGNLEIPVVVRQRGTDVTVDVRVTGGVYIAALDAAGTELTGTYTVQGLALPLSLRRSPSR
jgi:hypothetical protein